MNNYNTYIYLRSSEFWNIGNCYKLNYTNSLITTDLEFSNDEVVKGKYIFIIELESNKANIVLKLLYNYFNNLGYKISNDFYKKDILTLIKPYLENINIKCKIYNFDEINKVINDCKLNYIINNEYLKNIFKKAIKNRKNLKNKNI